MRLLHLVAGAMLLACTATANIITEDDKQNFIDKYAAVAITEMKFSGIPASITLAQAILESSWGRGSVAEDGNNYFCIKCFNGWDGPTVKAKDDEPGLSCFRKYSSAWQSFRDHSNFLKESNRYQPLFELEKTDFRAWAKGLREYGYATDNAYGNKLIGLIEEYGLWVYDYAIPVQHFNVIESPEMEQKIEVEQVEDLPYEPVPIPVWEGQSKPAETALDVPMYHIIEEGPAESSIEQRIQNPMKPNGIRKMKIRPIVPQPTLRLQWE